MACSFIAQLKDIINHKKFIKIYKWLKLGKVELK